MFLIIAGHDLPERAHYAHTTCFHAEHECSPFLCHPQSLTTHTHTHTHTHAHTIGAVERENFSLILEQGATDS